MQKDIHNKKNVYTEKTLHYLVLASLILFIWLLVWALVFKLCDETMVVRNYVNLSQMTVIERLQWDLIPFNYRGTEHYQGLQKITTVLNCFILVPFGVMFQYLFKKKRILKGALLSFAFILFVELTQLSTTLGNFATEDFITNMISYFVGVEIYYLIIKRFSLKNSIRLFALSTTVCAVMTVYSIWTYIDFGDTLIKILTKTY